MGCDIHLYREKHVNGRWLTADEWVDDDEYEIPTKRVPYEKRAYTGRNYNLFGLLSAGCRTEHEFSFAPRGMPLVCSDEVRSANEWWDADGHSHSYLYLHELREMQAHIQTAMIEISGMIDPDRLQKLRDTIAAGEPDWTLLFPYCQGTSDQTWVKFKQDVSAQFYFGDCLKKIIDSFDGIEGDNHRIVFWFDN